MVQCFLSSPVYQGIVSSRLAAARVVSTISPPLEERHSSLFPVLAQRWYLRHRESAKAEAVVRSRPWSLRGKDPWALPSARRSARALSRWRRPCSTDEDASAS